MIRLMTSQWWVMWLARRIRKKAFWERKMPQVESQARSLIQGRRTSCSNRINSSSNCPWSTHSTLMSLLGSSLTGSHSIQHISIHNRWTMRRSRMALGGHPKFVHRGETRIAVAVTPIATFWVSSLVNRGCMSRMRLVWSIRLMLLHRGDIKVAMRVAVLSWGARKMK